MRTWTIIFAPPAFASSFSVPRVPSQSYLRLTSSSGSARDSLFSPPKDRTNPGPTHMAARAFETQWKNSRRFNFREISFFGAQAEDAEVRPPTSANRNPRSHTRAPDRFYETRFRCARNTVLMQSTELIAGLAAVRCPDVLEMAVTAGRR